MFGYRLRGVCHKGPGRSTPACGAVDDVREHTHHKDRLSNGGGSVGHGDFVVVAGALPGRGLAVDRDGGVGMGRPQDVQGAGHRALNVLIEINTIHILFTFQGLTSGRVNSRFQSMFTRFALYFTKT